MSTHLQSNAEPVVRRREEATAAREHVGDGAGVTLANFERLSYAERVALRDTDPDRYAALRDGVEPGTWRPSADTKEGGR